MDCGLFYLGEVFIIIEVNNHNIVSAAKIHSESWKESHKSSCKIDFIEQHTVEHQAEYLHSEIEAGKQVYMLVETKPLGIDLSIRV